MIKSKERVFTASDRITDCTFSPKIKTPFHVTFAFGGSGFAKQSLTPKRHCNFSPQTPKVSGKLLFSETSFTSTKKAIKPIKEENNRIVSGPNSPPSTPFRFHSFPASLPRVHPRQKNLLRKRPTAEEESFDFSHNKNMSHDTVNTSVSSISVGSPVSFKRCTSPRRNDWCSNVNDEKKVPIQLFMSEESFLEDEVIGTRLNFNSLFSPTLEQKSNVRDEEATPVLESKEVLKELPSNDLTRTYDTTRTSSYPSRCSTPPRRNDSTLNESSIRTRQEQFCYDTSQCSPIIRTNDAPSSPWGDQKETLSISQYIESSSSLAKNRPMPDMTAFLGSSSTSSPLKLICPPTPVRTPTWVHNDPRYSLNSNQILADRNLGGFSSSEQILFDSGDDNIIRDKEHPEALVGVTISFHKNFDNLGQIGSGTFADVYKVRDRDGGNLYAIKRNRRQFRGKRDREMALGEVRTMLKLQSGEGCPYLLLFIRAWQEDGYFFSQTELCCRDSVRNLILNIRNGLDKHPSIIKHITNQTRLIPESSIWKICHDVAAGLKHIHSHGIVHYDIKPSNLYFVFDETLGCICKIGDFGIAGNIGSTEDGQEGDTKYMPQELLSSSVKHPSADLFSFGLTLYELASQLVWELPVEGPRWHEIRNGGPALVFSEERSFELVQLIRRMIGSDTKKRPRSEEILSIGKTKEMGTMRDAFLVDYVRDVEEFDAERERQRAAFQKDAMLRRCTPTGSFLGNNTVADAERNWTVRTPTSGLF